MLGLSYLLLMLWVTLILRYFERDQCYLWRQHFLPARHTRYARAHHLKHFGFAERLQEGV